MKTWMVIFICLFFVAGSLQAETWEVKRWSIGYPSPDQPDRVIAYTLTGSDLSLNQTTIYSPGYSSATAWELKFSGKWGACGKVENGEFLPDPFAVFVPDQNYGGHINWSLETPNGYSTTLLLGYSFEGNEAASYTPYIWDTQYAPVTGTLVLREFWPYYGHYSSYAPIQHSFNATYAVPEPTSLAYAIPAFLGLLLRRRSK